MSNARYTPGATMIAVWEGLDDDAIFGAIESKL